MPAPLKAIAPSTFVAAVALMSTLPVEPVIPAGTSVVVEDATVKSCGPIATASPNFTFPVPAVIVTVPPRIRSPLKFTFPATAPAFVAMLSAETLIVSAVNVRLPAEVAEPSVRSVFTWIVSLPSPPSMISDARKAESTEVTANESARLPP